MTLVCDFLGGGHVVSTGFLTVYQHNSIVVVFVSCAEDWEIDIWLKSDPRSDMKSRLDSTTKGLYTMQSLVSAA